MNDIPPSNFTLFIANSSSSFSGVYSFRLDTLAFRKAWNKLKGFNSKNNENNLNQFFNHALKFAHLGMLNFSLPSLNEQQLYYQFEESEKLDSLNKKFDFLTSSQKSEKNLLMFDVLETPDFFYDINFIKIFFDINSIYQKDIHFYKKQLQTSNQGFHFNKISYLFAFLIFYKVKIWNYLLFVSLYNLANKEIKKEVFNLPIFISRSDIFQFFKNKTYLNKISQKFDQYLLLDDYVTDLLDFVFKKIELVNKSLSKNYWVETYLELVSYKNKVFKNWINLESNFKFDKSLYYDNVFINIFEEFKSI